jgi:hypothetical protein
MCRQFRSCGRGNVSKPRENGVSFCVVVVVVVVVLCNLLKVLPVSTVDLRRNNRPLEVSLLCEKTISFSLESCSS